MKRRELLMLVASGSGVFAPALSDSDERSLDRLVDSGGSDATETDAEPAKSLSDKSDTSNDDDSAVVELTIELY